MFCSVQADGLLAADATASSMRIFTHSISPDRSQLERRRVQPPRSVQVRAEKLFQLDLIDRQGTAACGAIRPAAPSSNDVDPPIRDVPSRTGHTCCAKRSAN
jgi:hypothetical protein